MSSVSSVVHNLLYHTLVPFRLLVVVDAHEEDVARVFCYLRRIFLALDLVDGRVSSVVEFEFYHHSRFVDITPGYHHEVGISLACGILAVDDVIVLRPYIRDGEYAGEGVLVVVGKDARVLVVGDVDGARHCLPVAGDGGVEESLGILYRLDQRIPRCALMALFISSATSLLGM